MNGFKRRIVIMHRADHIIGEAWCGKHEEKKTFAPKRPDPHNPPWFIFVEPYRRCTLCNVTYDDEICHPFSLRYYFDNVQIIRPGMRAADWGAICDKCFTCLSDFITTLRPRSRVDITGMLYLLPKEIERLIGEYAFERSSSVWCSQCFRNP